jgi:hypothetical protein
MFLLFSSILVTLCLEPQPALAGFIYDFSGTNINLVAQGFELVTSTPVSTLQLFYIADLTPGSCRACDPAPALAAEFAPRASPGPYDRLGALTNHRMAVLFPGRSIYHAGNILYCSGI